MLFEEASWVYVVLFFTVPVPVLVHEILRSRGVSFVERIFVSLPIAFVVFVAIDLVAVFGSELLSGESIFAKIYTTAALDIAFAALFSPILLLSHRICYIRERVLIERASANE